MLRVKNSFFKKEAYGGFTLIEVLLVIAILAILAAVVIIAINPAKQFGEAQNAQRRSDIRAILDGVRQYSIDHQGALPVDWLPSASVCADGTDICRAGVDCDGIRLGGLTDTETYLGTIPTDPTSATDEISGYKIYQNGNGRVFVCAPNAYGDIDITIMQ